MTPEEILQQIQDDDMTFYLPNYMKPHILKAMTVYAAQQADQLAEALREVNDCGIECKDCSTLIQSALTNYEQFKSQP